MSRCPIAVIGLVALIALGCTGEGSTSQTNTCPMGWRFDDTLERCVELDDADLPDADTSDTSPADTGSDAPIEDTSADVRPQKDGDATLDTGPDTRVRDVSDAVEDTHPDPVDTGPVPDANNLPDCGGQYWDDHHDGTDPWNPFEIDCQLLAASWDCQHGAYEREVVKLINEKRSEVQECGGVEFGPADPLTVDPGMRCAARVHTWDMHGRGYGSHTTPDGVEPAERIQKAGSGHITMGENLHPGPTPQAAVDWWMSSSGHCRNIMCEANTHIGVGYYGYGFAAKFGGYSPCQL